MDAGQLRLNIFVHQARGTFWAYCPEFDLVASGATAEDARQAVVALIDEYLSQAQHRPGDANPFADEPEDWDTILIGAGLDANRTLN